MNFVQQQTQLLFSLTALLLIAALVPSSLSYKQRQHVTSSPSENYDGITKKMHLSYDLIRARSDFMEIDHSSQTDEIFPTQTKLYIFKLHQPADATVQYGTFNNLDVTVEFIFPPPFLSNSSLAIDAYLLTLSNEHSQASDIIDALATTHPFASLLPSSLVSARQEQKTRRKENENQEDILETYSELIRDAELSHRYSPLSLRLVANQLREVTHKRLLLVIRHVADPLVARAQQDGFRGTVSYQEVSFTIKLSSHTDYIRLSFSLVVFAGLILVNQAVKSQVMCTIFGFLFILVACFHFLVSSQGLLAVISTLIAAVLSLAFAALTEESDHIQSVFSFVRGASDQFSYVVAFLISSTVAITGAFILAQMVKNSTMAQYFVRRRALRIRRNRQRLQALSNDAPSSNQNQSRNQQQESIDLVSLRREVLWQFLLVYAIFFLLGCFLVFNSSSMHLEKVVLLCSLSLLYPLTSLGL